MKTIALLFSNVLGRRAVTISLMVSIFAALLLPTHAEMAVRLARANCHVVVNYFRHRQAAEEVAEVIRALEGPISMVQCGSDPGACDQMLPRQTNRIAGRIEDSVRTVPLQPA